MKQYINPQGQVTTKPQYVYNSDNVPFQATEKVLLSFGWTINDLPDPEPQPTEADLLRQQIKDKQQEITTHEDALKQTDYVFIKQSEAQLTSSPLPYDGDTIESYHLTRESHRTVINQLQADITALQEQLDELEPPMAETEE